MGIRKPLTVGQRNFAKQGDALDFYKEILWRYDVGQQLIGEDAIHVGNLVLRHRDVQDKVGAGVSHYEIMISDEGSRCFGIVQASGKKVTFSYKRCVTQLWT